MKRPEIAMIVDCAHYKDGTRQHEGPMSLEEAATCARGERGEDEFVWVGLLEPTGGRIRVAADSTAAPPSTSRDGAGRRALRPA